MEYIAEGVELLETIETSVYQPNPIGEWIMLAVIVLPMLGFFATSLFLAFGCERCAVVSAAIVIILIAIGGWISIFGMDKVFPPIYQGEEVTYRVYIHNDTINYSDFEKRFEIVKEGAVSHEYVIRVRE